jgi:methylthioribose-1-phosphate isomerase
VRNAIEWVDDHLEVIDQTLLPDRLEIRKLTSADDVVDAIARMVVRGAPAIGVCGAFGVVLGIDEGRAVEELAEQLANVRPTAVNLSRAVRRVADAAYAGADGTLRERALAEALCIRDEDREACRRIGEFGREELSSVQRVLTHCNTGRLATTGIGTALGIVYAKAQAREPIEVIATETRPQMQGARLTAWELAEAGIPVTLIADTAAGAAIAGRNVQAVVVGCDRVACNGDVANKIGTYSLAVLARANGVPFYVAGPLTSFDADAPDGSAIEIELRDSVEVRTVGTSVLAPEVEVWNPAFDVTPADLVTAFVTDAGVLRPPFEVSIAQALGSGWSVATP